MKDYRQSKSRYSGEESTAGGGGDNKMRLKRRIRYSLILLTIAAGVIVFIFLSHAGNSAVSWFALILLAGLIYGWDDGTENDRSGSIRNSDKETRPAVCVNGKEKNMKEKRKAAEQKSRDAGWTGYYIPPEVFMSDDPYKIRKGILKSTGHLIPVRYLNNDKNIGKRVGEFLDLMDDEEDL